MGPLMALLWLGRDGPHLASCDTVTLLPLVILHLEPHHMTPELTERLALN
jgi:hypothetical protein